MVNYTKCPLFALGYNSNIIGKLGNFIKFYGKIPDILVLITGHFGLFKTPALRLGEAGTTQTQSQTRRLIKAKINFKSVRKTITGKKGYKFSITYFQFVQRSYIFIVSETDIGEDIQNFSPQKFVKTWQKYIIIKLWCLYK